MSTQPLTTGRGLGAIGAFGAVLALTVVLWSLFGCAPKEAPDEQVANDQEQASDTSALDGQPVNWTMESDCATCHASEAESPSDPACTQAIAHEAEGITCMDCHTEEETLATAHADVKFGDKTTTKATVATVDPTTCESCHGTLEEVAALTTGSTALTDSKGTTVNPHARPASEQHDANPMTCTDCHNNHSDDLPKDAMSYCAQCHHRGTFECGTCHELR